MTDWTGKQSSIAGFVSLLAAAALLFAGVTNIVNAVHAVRVLYNTGMTQWGRCGFGLTELSGAAGLLIPRLRFATALAMTTLMVGAILVYMVETRGNLAVAIIIVTLTTTAGWMSGRQDLSNRA